MVTYMLLIGNIEIRARGRLRKDLGGKGKEERENPRLDSGICRNDGVELGKG